MIYYTSNILMLCLDQRFGFLSLVPRQNKLSFLRKDKTNLIFKKLQLAASAQTHVLPQKQTDA